MNALQRLWQKSLNDQLGLLSAQIAYTLTLALFPFFIILIIVLNTFQINTSEIQGVLAVIFPATTLDLILNVLTQTTQQATNLVSPLTIIAVLAIATGLIPLLHAINRIYGVKETRCYIRQYLTSLLGTLMIMTAIVATLIFFIVDIYFWQIIVRILPFLNDYTAIYRLLQFLVPALLFISSLTLIYRVLPNRHVGWKNAFIAALFSTIFWVVITVGFSFYVSNISQKYTQLYGGLAAVMALITWLYFTAFAFLWGIEISYSFHEHQQLRTNYFLVWIDIAWNWLMMKFASIGMKLLSKKK